MHLSLDSEGAPPEEWLVSRICEEFHCTPLEAVDQPYDLTLTIMHLRNYAATKSAIDSAKKQSDIVPGPQVDEVRAIMEELFAERHAKAKSRV